MLSVVAEKQRILDGHLSTVAALEADGAATEATIQSCTNEIDMLKTEW